MSFRNRLKAQRAQVESAWSDFQASKNSSDLRSEVLESWERSQASIDLEISAAPTAFTDTESVWADNPLAKPVEGLESSLNDLAEEGGFVVAITDPNSQILWTTGSSYMRNKAARANFAPGSDWSESAVGTNALDLALRSQQNQTVFSAEHFAPLVHGWVCYAAPIFDLESNTCLGVIDLSTTWDNANPLASMAADSFAELISHEVTKSIGSVSSLRLKMLGIPKVDLGLGTKSLPKRQQEILFVLALSPQGISLEALHDAIYGDAAVSVSTLKAELSHLRQVIPNVIESRPYRLNLQIELDYTQCMRELKAGQFSRAIEFFTGPLMPTSLSPFIEERREHLMAALHSAAIQTFDADALIKYLDLVPHDLAACEHLASLIRTSDPRFAICQAHLQRANRIL